MNILGITLGWQSTAALVVDGEVVACASEERFSRLKNDMGYPKKAIEYCLEVSGIRPDDIDQVAMASEDGDADDMLTRRYDSYSVDDWIREQKEYWYPLLYENNQKNYIDIFADKAQWNTPPWDWSKIDFTSPKLNSDERTSSFSQLRFDAVADHLKIDREKIVSVNHHYGHAIYGCYGTPIGRRTALVFTIDGVGDGSNATINILKDGILTNIYKTNDCYLGRLFKYITLMLGMKPHQDEYKVMGLAPYSSEYHLSKPLDLFNRTMQVDGLDFKYDERPTDMYFWFRDQLSSSRFDGIAGGLQRYLEQILCQWIGNAVRETGISTVIISGGVAMNVKASMQIAQMPEVDELFVPPSPGDESQAIAAAWACAHDSCIARGVNPMNEIQHLKTVYLGPSYSKTDIASAIEYDESNKDFIVTENVSPAQVAERLAEGNVIGRFAGRMEFGARALGNRSIIADPRRSEIIKTINDKIKNRDFWMPFAPTMLDRRSDDYIVNPKKTYSPTMTVAFDSTDLAQKEASAVLHPADYTTRPQILTRQANPSYYDLIEAFESKTGVGILLNTSFNLHGEPIVESPADAISTFRRSGLDILLLEDTMIEKSRR